MAVRTGAAASAGGGATASSRQTAYVIMGLIIGLIVFELSTRGDDGSASSSTGAGRGGLGASMNMAGVLQKASSLQQAKGVALEEGQPSAGGGASATGDASEAVEPKSGTDARPAVVVSTGEEETGARDDNGLPALVPTSKASTAGPDTKPACWPTCYPFHLRSGTLFVQRKPNSAIEPSMMRVSGVRPDAKTGKPVFDFGPGIKRVAIDIGTHADPDTQQDWWGERDLGMIWFEPIVTLHTHPMHLGQTRATQGIATNRVVGIPAVVAPKPGHMSLFLSAVSGCTSLLEMNDHALKDPSVMKGSFVGSDSAFPNFATAKVGFTGCIERLKGRKNREVIPAVRGDDVVAMIPPELEVSFLASDAQGFDLHVVSSFGATIPRIDIILVECQDLPEGHAMFLTKGAFSCSDVIACMKQYSPQHQLIAAANGEPANTCTTNNPSHERNCLFRRMDRPFFKKTPKLLTRVAYEIKFPPRKVLQCPALERPEGVATLDDSSED